MLYLFKFRDDDRLIRAVSNKFKMRLDIYSEISDKGESLSIQVCKKGGVETTPWLLSSTIIEGINPSRIARSYGNNDVFEGVLTVLKSVGFFNMLFSMSIELITYDFAETQIEMLAIAHYSLTTDLPWVSYNVGLTVKSLTLTDASVYKHSVLSFEQIMSKRS